MRHAGLHRLLLAAVLVAAPASAAEIAELVGQPVVEVQLFLDGIPQRDEARFELLETRQAQPLSLREVRESVTHLYSLGDVFDVAVSAWVRDGGGVVLRYDLVPLTRRVWLEMRGDLGRPAGELIDVVTRRFGRVVRTEELDAAVTLLEAEYRAAGRFAARIEPAPLGAGRLRFDIDQGPPAQIASIELRGAPEDGRAGVLERLGLVEGGVYDPIQLDARLAEFEEDVRGRRYYEARLRHEAIPTPDGLAVDIVLDIQTGSPVTIRFDGDPVPDADLDELVPVADEGSIDEDLLEDSSLRVEDYLRGLGYRDARVAYRRLDELGLLTVVFDVDRGAEYRVVSVELKGHTLLGDPELLDLLAVRVGEPLVMEALQAGGTAIANRYAALGYRGVVVQPRLEEVDIGGEPSVAPAVVPVSLVVEVLEGAPTVVGQLRFEGNRAFDDAALADVIGLAGLSPGAAYFAPTVATGRAALQVFYLNQGYETVAVEVQPSFDETGTTADLSFVLVEGAQTLVDHVLIVGNRQIDSSTIRQELAVRPGQPLGQADLDETRRRLAALGLFRGVDLRQFSHGDRLRRDVVVVVEEAPATRVGYGGGLEVSERLRATDAGVAAERLEFAPRGFFEIGRRNLWGKNRSIDLFTRVSVRRDGESTTELTESGLGFNEYRVLLNYREPRAFRQSGDLLVSGFIEQAIRPSFDLFSRGGNAELVRALGPTTSATMGYTYGRNRVTNEQLLPEDRPLVDRLFPELTLSSFTTSLVSDSRDDPLDTSAGELFAVESEFAFRRLGSEVGFAKATVQSFVYRQLPGGVVFAGGGRLGLARGFVLELAGPPIPVFGDDGVLVLVPGETVNVVQALPASERFFAGGDTTVRGFALDRLGDGPTIDPNGFPTGGNAMVVLNSELRVPVTDSIQVVGFLDAGNVFDRAANLSLGRIRGGAGFGIRYRSPVGPIRVDLGFKLDRREFAGELESPTALHLSIGQAF